MLAFPKPKKREPVSKWGIYRKYPKPIESRVKKVIIVTNDNEKNNKHTEKLRKTFNKAKNKKPISVKRIGWDGDPLLEPPYQGHYLYEVTDELYAQVFERAGGKCENPDCDNLGTEVNHIVGHSRVAHLENLNLLCVDCHRTGKDAFHKFGKFYKYCMKKYQDWCFKANYTEDKVRWLLAKKDGRLF